MELRILGPLEVVAEGGVVAPRAGKQRSLLAFLLLHPNERISADRLIDALWGERPPPTAAAALQNQVARLRALLGAERIETAGSSYLLRLEPGELDLDRFADLVRRAGEAPAEERAELLRVALSLWRGRPLVDVEDEVFAQVEIARLEELRLVALHGRIEAELELGLHSALVPELEALAREHPLREGVRATLMLALYRCGRQADALEVYQQTRRLLVDELGIEPGQPLQRLHQRILLQDAELDAVAATAAPAPPSASPLPAPPREVRKSVTAVTLSVEAPPDCDPELLCALEDQAAATLRRAVERHGGILQQTAGFDSLAVFGVPVLHEDDALRAVRAADEARTALAALDAALAVRAGIATGIALAGAEAVGGPIGTARELARRAGPGEILLAPETRSLVRDAVACEPADDGALRLVRLDPTAPGLVRRLDTPLVDRERELLLLETAFAHALRSSTCHLFTLCGPGGIGKSRLVAELVRTLAGEAIVLSGACLAYGEGITYWPVAEIVRRAAGADHPAEVRERLAALVPDPDGEVVADRLAGLLGLGPPAGADEIAWAVRRLLEALAATRPLVVVVDDLQYAEPTLLDLLEGLADRSRGAPILLACLARPELLDARPSWGGGKTNATTVSLEPLDGHESALLLDHLPGAAELTPATRSRLLETAGGHPLFVEELLSMLAEQGRTSGGGDWLALPPTVHALLAGRLERLPATERLALECAAVEGEVFHAGTVAALATELDAATRDAALVALLRKDFVRSSEPQLVGGEAFRFRHALVRDAAYASLPKGRRATLHERFATWLEGAAGARLPEFEEVLAHHLEQAFMLRDELGSLDDAGRALGERAGRLLAGTGRRAHERGDIPAATNLLERAARLLPPDDEERLRLLIDLGDALRTAGVFDRADTVLAEAASRSAVTGRHAISAHADLERAYLRTDTDSDLLHAFERMRSAATSLIADPVAAGDAVAVAKALFMLGLWHWNELRHGEAAELYRRCRETADAAGARSLRWRGQIGIALTFINGPLPVVEGLAALEAIRGAVHGDESAEAKLMIYAGALESLRGRFDEARALHAGGAKLLDELGHSMTRANLDHYAILAEQAAGDPVAAERIARRAFETLSALGTAEGAKEMAAALAETLHLQGRDDEAERYLAVADELSGAPLFWTRRATTRAKVRARLGDPAGAVALAREAVALLEPTDALVLRGDAHLALCEALLAAGDPDAAASAAAQAAAFYDAKGATALSARAAAACTRSSVA